MKKLFACLGICFLSLFAGVFLVSCCNGPTSFRISLGQVDDNVYVQIEEMPEEEVLPADLNNGWTVSTDAQLRVSVIARERGIVMNKSTVQVKINGEDANIFGTDNYDMFDVEKLTYGWFNLPMLQLKRDIQISVTGTTKKTSTFTFNLVSDNASDEALVKKLQSTYICTDDTDNYVQLYQILNRANKSYTKEFNADASRLNPYRTFKMKFQDGQKVINDLYDYTNFDIFGVTSNSFSSPINSIFVSGDHLVVNLGNNVDGREDYTINVNFDALTLRSYTFSYPQEQDAYEISIDKENITYEEGATLTFTKKDADKYDYSKLEIKIGNVTLESSGSTDDTITYTIPTKLTPFLAGFATYSNGQLVISVNGIEQKSAD